MRSHILIIGTLVAGVWTLDNGVGRTPAMGWNSWNKFGCNINESVIKETADNLKSKGFADLGYIYVNIDDCWNTDTRTSDGKQQADPTNFPSGMKALGDYIHDQGLKYGIYSSAGTKTCEGKVGSLYYEDTDAATFAEWGVDYLKYDNCYNEKVPAQLRYPPMKEALNKTGRAIYYSICSWGEENVAEWANNTGNSWRTTGDITATWARIEEIFYQNEKHPQSAGPGGWNDPDMLEVGNGGLTYTEERTHFALWSIIKSPLIIGCDLTNTDQKSLDIMKAKLLIAANQDSLGQQATCIQDCDTNIPIYSAFNKDSDGYYSIVVVNWSSFFDRSTTLDVIKSRIAPSKEYMCYYDDMWTGEKIGSSRGLVHIDDIPPHGSVALHLFCRRVLSSDEVEEPNHVKYHEEVNMKVSMEEFIGRKKRDETKNEFLQ